MVAEKRTRRTTTDGKERLKAALEAEFGEVRTEATFPWLVAARPDEGDRVLGPIYDAIRRVRRKDFLATGKRGFKCTVDFYIESAALIVEVDERQHFSRQRAASFRVYPVGVALGFDRQEWTMRCLETQAVDGDKNDPARDEKRAYYDAVRDVLVPRNGLLPLVRIWADELESTEGLREAMARVRRHVKAGKPAAKAAKGEPRSKKHVSGITRVARINLDMGLSVGDLRAKAEHRGTSKGTAHRKVVRDSFRRGGHVERIGRLVDQAVESGADIVVLPATSILVDGTVTLGEYQRRLKVAPFVVAGLLDAGTLGEKGDDREGALVIGYGRKLQSLEPPTDEMAAVGGHLGDLPAIVAVSSTVRDVRRGGDDYASWIGRKSARDTRLLILDLGHEQYTGRYVSTLRAVRDHVVRDWDVTPAVILAQWRGSGYVGTCPWFFSPHGTTWERLPALPGAEFADEVDLIDVRW